MDIHQDYETHEQRQLFPGRGCRQILTPPDARRTQHRRHSSGRLPPRRTSCFQQPFTLKHHRAQKHHLDLRLGYHWIAFSWAMYAMPSYCPDEPCVATQVEDHLREYMTFEGVHEEGKQGAGPTIVIDQGLWQPLPESLDIEESLRFGCLRLAFREGTLMRGIWSLIRRKDCYRQENPRWLMTKEFDEYAVRKNLTAKLDWTALRSCRTGMTIEETESDWHLGVQSRRHGGDSLPFPQNP